MRKGCGVALAVFGVLLATGIAEAQAPVRWQHNTLEIAKQTAAQTNRLVLIHFWADWCGACKRMDFQVFNQPQVAQIIEANYVPVKVNADHFPATTQQFGVTALPTDVVITPQGQVLHQFRGAAPANQYAAQLNEVANAARRQTPQGMYAQGNAVPPVGPTQGLAVAPSSGVAGAAIPNGNATVRGPMPGAMPSAVAPPATNDRYATHFQPPTAQPPMMAAAGSPSVPPTMPGNPMVNNLPMGGNPAAPYAPAGSGPVDRSMGPIPGNPQVGAAANRPPQMTQQMPPQAPIDSRYGNMAPNPAQAAPPRSPSVAPSPVANPALALDGYCPVTLTEKAVWNPGDRRWGARHEGYTYLFASPEAQRDFLANPERYAPVLSGNDVVLAFDEQTTKPGARAHGVFFGGRVFLFSSEASLERFSRNPNYYADRASQAMRTRAVPSYQRR